jgi:hypothetical protein
MLKAEERMELAVLRRHRTSIQGARARDGALAQHRAVLPSWRRSDGDAQGSAEAARKARHRGRSVPFVRRRPFIR